jgi:L-ribulose-5-phosphate 4-epimerase
MSEFSDLAQELAMGCRILAEQEIIDAYGHLSARYPGREDAFVINRGMSPALAQAEDFIALDFEGKVLEGNGFPNAEWPIHACIYQARADVGSVLHSHSDLSRIFSLSPVKLRGLVMQQAAEWFNPLPLYLDPALINTTTRGDKLAATLGQESAVLLRGHGDAVVGSDVRDSAMRSVRLRMNARVMHGVLSHGGEPNYWTREEADAWMERMHQHLSPQAAAALVNREWDYYVSRVDGRLKGLLHL